MYANAEGHRLVGHFFWDKVDAVFLDPVQGQYIIDPEEGKMFNRYLLDGETWVDRSGMPPVPAEQRPKYLRRAVHEMGHAVACFLTGVKVEFVTIMPIPAGVFTLEGLCRYDYGLDSFRIAEPDTWNKRLIVAHLGGPISEREYLSRSGLTVEPEHVYAWSGDESHVSSCLEQLTPDLTRRERVKERAALAFAERLPALWTGVEKAAGLLLERWAISGQMARECFGDIEPLDLTVLD
jgi:hypothetical protein